jgi:hypothetical protein
MSLVNFPVYLASNGFKTPENGTYYVVAKDGIYLHVERLHGSSLVKVQSIPFLDEAKLNTKFTLPNIPTKIMHQAKTFFSSVFEKHQSESYLTLLYSKKLNDYKLWCPTQTVSYASVNYDRTDTVPVDERDYIGSEGDAWQMVGTIHSHCNFSAFHSGTDEADEATFDGIHLTFGHVNSDKFSIASSICFNNNRTKMSPLDVADGLIADSEEEVTDKTEYKYRGATYERSTKRIEYWFRLDELNEAEKEIHASFLAHVLPVWLSKVNKYISPAKTDSIASSSWTYQDTKSTKQERQSDWLDIWKMNEYNRKNRGSIHRDNYRTYDDDYYGIREWDGD